MEELSLSYNGGKDCLVLLVLILACLPRHFEPTPNATPTPPSHPPPPLSLTPANGLAHSQPPPNTPLSTTPRAATPNPFPATLQSVYIVSKHPFAEVDAFVEDSTAKYHLDLCRYGLPMRAALEAYLAERPRLKAVFVGTRRTDPHGANLKHFDPTDEGWPAFVRVHPVIDWHYAEIWAVCFTSYHLTLFSSAPSTVALRGGLGGRGPDTKFHSDKRRPSTTVLTRLQFIRYLKIPYLSLYDKGYTSLGGTEDTHPNPQLKKQDGAEEFRPAYELMADDEERLGRDW